MCFCVILRWKSTLSKASETSKMLSNCLWDAVWPMRTHWLYPVFPLTLDERKTSCLALLVGRVESSGQIKSQKQSHFSDSGRRGKDGEGSSLTSAIVGAGVLWSWFLLWGLYLRRTLWGSLTNSCLDKKRKRTTASSCLMAMVVYICVFRFLYSPLWHPFITELII